MAHPSLWSATGATARSEPSRWTTQIVASPRFLVSKAGVSSRTGAGPTAKGGPREGEHDPMTITNRDLPPGTLLTGTLKKTVYQSEVVPMPDGIRYRCNGRTTRASAPRAQPS